VCLLKNKLTYILLFILSAILLTLIQQPYNLSLLAWIAWVPFVMGALSDVKTKQIVISSYIIALIYWLFSLYWLIPITFVGWAVLCLYLAVFWPIVAVALRFCTQRKIPLWFSLAVLVVGEESIRGWLFGWRFLAHSQFSNLHLIQIADIFGTAGISFVIAMVNGLICDIIFYSHEDTKTRRFKIVSGAVITLIVLSGTLYYGKIKIDETPQYTQAGPKIGIVQCNVPVKAGEDTTPFEQVFLDQLSDSRYAFATARPALIIWPETMVETVLDESYLKIVAEGYASKVIHNALVRHANEGVNVLVGAFAADAVVDGNHIKLKTRYNTAFLYEPNESYSRQHYNKIWLVPFGEYIPLKKELPFLYKFLLSMTPYDFDYTLDRGTEFTIFKIKSEGKNYNFAASICYEDTVPYMCKTLVAPDGIKQAEWLVNISNDGWFVKETSLGYKVSSELRQHMAICVFRAIENRVPIIRCANTGISCMIDSVGNIKDGFIAGTLKEKAAERTAQSGWLVDSIKIDKRVTVFSKHRQILALTCAMCLILSAVMSIYTNKKDSEPQA
jgi:apolipoprotein N-acyltransferase